MDIEIVKLLRDVIKEELKPINSKLDSLEDKVSSLDSKVSSLDSKVSSLENKVENLSTQVEENTQILKALEHSAEVSRAEQDLMKNDIAHIKGTVESIKKDLSQVEMVTANNWADIARLKAVK